ncbi:unnamed protein product [Rotaria socialis]
MPHCGKAKKIHLCPHVSNRHDDMSHFNGKEPIKKNTMTHRKHSTEVYHTVDSNNRKLYAYLTSKNFEAFSLSNGISNNGHQ